MKSPIKTISLPEETYNILRSQAEKENRTIGGQIKHLLELNDNGDGDGDGDGRCGE